MNPIERRVRAALNPASTAFAGWWCHSAWRHVLTGHGLTGDGLTARQWRLLRHGKPVMRHGKPVTRHGTSDAEPLSAEQMADRMMARAKAIDDLLSRADHEL
jgi:hypothetical protein